MYLFKYAIPLNNGKQLTYNTHAAAVVKKKRVRLKTMRNDDGYAIKNKSLVRTF